MTGIDQTTSPNPIYRRNLQTFKRGNTVFQKVRRFTENVKEAQALFLQCKPKGHTPYYSNNSQN